VDFQASDYGRGLPQHHNHRRSGPQTGARNIVMHAYEHLKPELIKEMAEMHVPELLAHCLSILGDE
jgi:uncharacterized protein with HEPN domain